MNTLWPNTNKSRINNVLPIYILSENVIKWYYKRQEYIICKLQSSIIHYFNCIFVLVYKYGWVKGYFQILCPRSQTGIALHIHASILLFVLQNWLQVVPLFNGSCSLWGTEDLFLSVYFIKIFVVLFFLNVWNFCSFYLYNKLLK